MATALLSLQSEQKNVRHPTAHFAVLAAAMIAIAEGASCPAAPPAPKQSSIDPAIAPNSRMRSRRPTARHASPVRPQLAVDLVKLRSGRTLRGAVVRQAGDGLIMLAVSRSWMEKLDPGYFAKLIKDEATTRRAALEQLRDRIKNELSGRPDESQSAVFLRREQKRVDALLAEAVPDEPPQFLWLDLTGKQIAKIAVAPLDRRQIAAWSWYERLPNVETRPADELRDDLKRKGIDPTQPPPDLSDRFPPRLQDDREWSARLGVIAHALEKPIDFQGTGDLLVRVERGGKAPDLGALLGKLLAGQLESLLKELGDGKVAAATPRASDDWLKPAFHEAEREQGRALRATRVELNLAGGQVAVTSAFAVRLDNGSWEKIWSVRETQDPAQSRVVAEAAIANDPQVKSALGSIKSLGIGGDDQVAQAIRFGAATMAAQQAVDRQFFAFEGPLLQRLDGPPLWWPR